MMEKGNARHMFPGGNTSRGFYSYYDFVIPYRQAERLFIIKGGPGTGKSTFMKKLAARLGKNGYDIEFMHCSSDPDSLDGIVIPALSTAVIDGTAPHVVDLENPGATDEIINLGDFWNIDEIRGKREEIVSIKSEIGRNFKRAYRYLAAAASVYSDNFEIFERAMDRQKVAMEADRIIKEYFHGDAIARREGGVRKLFATAITPQGLKSGIPTLLNTLNTGKVIVLKGNAGTGTGRIIEKVKDAAIERGFYAEVFYCALFPEKPEHIVIPEKNLGIFTSNKYHAVIPARGEVIDFGKYLDKEVIGSAGDIIEYNRFEFEGLLNRAIMTLEQAKKLHDILEKYYISSMNFDAVNELIEKIAARIESLMPSMSP
jgi:hypothetical protein